MGGKAWRAALACEVMRGEMIQRLVCVMITERKSDGFALVHDYNRWKGFIPKRMALCTLWLLMKK